MKRIFKNILILILSLVVLFLIIYTAQIITNWRYRNSNWLKSIDANRQVSLKELNELFNNSKFNNFQNNSWQQKWTEFLLLIPILKNDVALQQKLISLEPIVNDLDSGVVISKIIKGETNALTPLQELNEILAFLEKYNLESIKNLKYQISNWLSFLGGNNTKNYLLLFQESKISRPSGGFLGDYGILSFENGKANISGDIIFDLDDILIKNIIPPLPLQVITNKWFFHDANWFFDFPTTAKKILEFYYDTGLQLQLNGVIALNNSVIESILTITGPIELTDYGQTITTNNFSTFFIEQILKGTQPTNLEKEIFSTFINKLFIALKNLSLTDYQKLQELLSASLKNKDIQVFSTDDQVEYFFDSLNGAGKIVESRQDYLGVVFNNLDQNLKVDERIKNISLETKISTNTVSNVLTIKSPALERSDFNRETYLKVYLPKGVTITRATGAYLKDKPDWPFEKLNYQIDPDIQNIENRQIIDSTNSISIFEESSKTVIGAWVRLSAQSFTLAYDLPFSPVTFNQWNLIVQKQSGQNIKFLYNLILPSNKKLTPTLFEFNKLVPLTQDLNLNFGIE